MQVPGGEGVGGGLRGVHAGFEAEEDVAWWGGGSGGGGGGAGGGVGRGRGIGVEAAGGGEEEGELRGCSGPGRKGVLAVGDVVWDFSGG